MTTTTLHTVFVSSTYHDLVQERAGVKQCLLSSSCMPLCMEEFPASNFLPIDYIYKMIKLSDYYLLILGGRYGSIIEEEGVSYTEKEYDYAIKHDIPVLVFTHQHYHCLDEDKRDSSPTALEKLNAFYEKVRSRKLCSEWADKTELERNVLLSISRAKEIHPRQGWQRTPTHDSEMDIVESNKSRDSLVKINEVLRQENNALQVDLGAQPLTVDIDGLNFDIDCFVINQENKERLGPYKVNLSDIFRAVGVDIFREWQLEKEIFRSDIIAELGAFDGIENFKLTPSTANEIRFQFGSRELIKIDDGKTQVGADIAMNDDSHFSDLFRQNGTKWKLTTLGEKYLMALKNKK
tara:strand:- start:7606 stop:8655 length:1050 start_codon:yes stop_codon:yes gene_type:complete